MWSFAALAAGYRGLGFWADSSLTRREGRVLLTEMALIRAETQLIESLIARGQDPIGMLDTFEADPVQIIQYNALGNQGAFNTNNRRQPPAKERIANATLKAASISTIDNRGRLLLIADYAAAGQYQPPQMAMSELTIRVKAPETAQAWEISAGRVRYLKRERSTGGLKITIPDFSVTSIVLVTTDFDGPRSLVSRIQDAVKRIAPMATNMAISQARIQLDELVEIDHLLALDGHQIKPEYDDPLMPERYKIDEAAEFIAKARASLKAAEDMQAQGLFHEAFSEARRVSRPARYLMRLHWEKAYQEFNKATMLPGQRAYELGWKRRSADLEARVIYPRPKPEKPKYPFLLPSPVATPPLASFNMIPQQYIWLSWAKELKFGPNLFAAGSFDDGEQADALKEAGWEDVHYAMDGVKTKFELKEGGWDKEKKGGRVLRLSVTARKDLERGVDAVPAFFDHPPVALRSRPIAVGAHQLIRIRVMIKMAIPSPAGVGGVIVRDSIGGEALQFRQTDPIPDWRELVLYRRAPTDGQLTVTLALAGFGWVEFDDLRIDRVVQEMPAGEPAEIARRPQPRQPDAALPPRASANAGATSPARAIR
jgi:hypothetical protein